MKKTASTLLIITAIFFVNGCSVADDIKDTLDAVECANLLENVADRNNDDNPDCAQIRSDLEQVENTCGEFLTAEQREQLAFIRANCDETN